MNEPHNHISLAFNFYFFYFKIKIKILKLNSVSERRMAININAPAPNQNDTNVIDTQDNGGLYGAVHECVESTFHTEDGTRPNKKKRIAFLSLILLCLLLSFMDLIASTLNTIMKPD